MKTQCWMFPHYVCMKLPHYLAAQAMDGHWLRKVSELLQQINESSHYKCNFSDATIFYCELSQAPILWYWFRLLQHMVPISLNQISFFSIMLPCNYIIFCINQINVQFSWIFDFLWIKKIIKSAIFIPVRSVSINSPSCVFNFVVRIITASISTT